MSETLITNKKFTDQQIYEALIPQINELLNPDEPLISNLSNVTAVLKEAFDKISWVGFYLLMDDKNSSVNKKLFLGPFQGKVACTVIEIGNGVCGNAVLQRKTIIVDDVDKYPGHIACDSDSHSEIVIPLIKNNQVMGVLDLDSHQLSALSETDKKYLEVLTNNLVEKLSF